MASEISASASDPDNERPRRSFVRVITDELGISTLAKVSPDVRWLILMRFVRLLAFGQSSLILVLFFESLNVPLAEVGFFMSATLAGDVIISFLLTLFADGLGRRKVLLAGSFMMMVSGCIFAVSNNFYLLLFAAVVGVISPSGNEIGPFRAVEESALAQLVTMEERAYVYAWHAVIGAFGAALGSVSCGPIVDYLMRDSQNSAYFAYRFIFMIYSVLGLIKLLCTLRLSEKVERPVVSKDREADSETAPLLTGTSSYDSSTTEDAETKRRRPGWFSRVWGHVPTISTESKKIVVSLSLLFALDSFASSLASFSWTSYYIANKFPISTTTLGSIFFTTGIVGSLSTLAAASISKRLGPILTMVVTHLPSSSLLILLPLPDSLIGTMIIMVVRSLTATMDVAPRQVFLSAVVLKEERTSVMGWVNVVKTLAQMVGAFVTGKLTAIDKQWLCFVLAGSLKVAYDLGILATFAKVQLDRD
jgi:predicted MFS family arabinose efflux permease